MNCHEAQQWRHAFADGELDLATASEMEHHVHDCPDCAKSCEDMAAFRTMLRSADPAFKAPAGLWDRVRPEIESRPERTKSGRPQPTRPWLYWAFPTALAAVVVWIAIVFVSNDSMNRQLVHEVASSHIRSLQPGHLMDIASTDQHTVKPWFDGKLDFAPPVNNLALHGFPLVGGRLDYLGERPVAALVYQRDKHLINLFVWPAVSESAPGTKKSFIERGYNLLRWTTAGMNFWAVSDLNRVELE